MSAGAARWVCGCGGGPERGAPESLRCGPSIADLTSTCLKLRGEPAERVRPAIPWNCGLLWLGIRCTACEVGDGAPPIGALRNRHKTAGAIQSLAAPGRLIMYLEGTGAAGVCPVWQGRG